MKKVGGEIDFAVYLNLKTVSVKAIGVSRLHEPPAGHLALLHKKTRTVYVTTASL